MHQSHTHTHVQPRGRLSIHSTALLPLVHTMRFPSPVVIVAAAARLAAASSHSCVVLATDAYIRVVLPVELYEQTAEFLQKNGGIVYIYE